MIAFWPARRRGPLCAMPPPGCCGLDRPTFVQEVGALRRLTKDPPTAFYLEREAERAFAGEHPFASPIYWAAFTFSGALTSEGDPHV